MKIQKIIQELQDRGFTQIEIAAETGVLQSQISALLRGRRKDIAYTSGKRIEEFAAQKFPELFRAGYKKRKTK